MHSFNVNKILTKVHDRVEIDSNEINPVYFESVINLPKVGKKQKKAKAGKTNKKGKKGAKNKKLNKNVIDIRIPAHFLFTDPVLATMESMHPSNATVSRSFIFMSVENLLTIAQKFLLNPLVFKILKINNFPSNLLLRHG